MTRKTDTARPRIALFGPVLPFRSGIAQHTTRVHRAARPMTELLTISFTRQYPAWLFPGKSDRDPSYEGHREPGVEYLVDSFNPLTWSRAAKRVLEHEPEIAVIPWWTIFFAPCFWYLARRLQKAGVKVVFLCHNVVDHESAPWKILLSKEVLKQAHSYLVQSREDEKAIRKLLPGAEIRFHPHPLYDQFPEPRNELPRRAELELLFFGFVRPYKGLDILIDALGMVDPSRDFILTIAGEFWEGKNETMQRIAGKSLEEKTDILDRYLTEQEVADLFRRADLVVLPYRSASGSGVIPVAYHYDKPVVVTRVGGLPDMVVEGETGVIVAADSPDELAGAISGISQEKLAGMKEKIADFKKKLTWEGLVKAILVG